MFRITYSLGGGVLPVKRVTIFDFVHYVGFLWEGITVIRVGISIFVTITDMYVSSVVPIRWFRLTY